MAAALYSAVSFELRLDKNHGKSWFYVKGNTFLSDSYGKNNPIAELKFRLDGNTFFIVLLWNKFTVDSHARTIGMDLLTREEQIFVRKLAHKLLCVTITFLIRHQKLNGDSFVELIPGLDMFDEKSLIDYYRDIGMHENGLSMASTVSQVLDRCPNIDDVLL
jgi:hypothetical protein